MTPLEQQVKRGAAIDPEQGRGCGRVPWVSVCGVWVCLCA